MSTDANRRRSEQKAVLVWAFLSDEEEKDEVFNFAEARTDEGARGKPGLPELFRARRKKPEG